MFRRPKPRNTARALFEQHFSPVAVDDLITAGRTFPVTTRVDLQLALERQFVDRYPATPKGIHAEYAQETLSIAHLVSNGHNPVRVGPLQHDEIDMGEAMAVSARALSAAADGRHRGCRPDRPRA